jgi:phosphoglycolate phosphatase
MQKSLFLFDLDWTLIYTGGAGVRALDYAFEKHFGIAAAMKHISPDGKTDPAIIREMIRVHLKRDPQPGELEQLCNAYVDRLRVEVADGPGYIIMPGIPEILGELSEREDVVLGLGTGNLMEGAMVKLARADLMSYFKFGGYGSDSEDRPEVLRIAVQRGEAVAGQKVAPERVFVIGDHVRDILAGQAIGARTVGVATGHITTEEMAKHNPHYIFNDLSDTHSILATLLPNVS